MTDEQLVLYARYDAYTHGNNEIFRTNPTVLKAMAYLEEEGNIGDTSLSCLYEDEYNAVYLSIDSNIKVLVNVAKNFFSKSESIELQ